MAFTIPYWLENSGQHHAQTGNLLLDTLVNGQEGVCDTSSLAVAALGTPAMQVTVAAGRGFVKGDTNSQQGGYYIFNDGAITLNIAASDPSNPRIDRVVAEVLDDYWTGSSTLVQARVITGTPAGSPSAPALPSSALHLALIDVDAGATTIVTGDITDGRVLAPLVGAVFARAEVTASTSATAGIHYVGLNLPAFTFPQLPAGRNVRIYVRIPALRAAGAGSAHDLISVYVKDSADNQLDVHDQIVHAIYGQDYNAGVAFWADLDNTRYSAGTSVTIKIAVGSPTWTTGIVASSTKRAVVTAAIV